MDANLSAFFANWRARNGIMAGAALSEPQIAQLAQEIQAEIRNVSVWPDDPTGLRSWKADASFIGYSGTVGSQPAWTLVKAMSEGGDGNVFYISDTPAGRLLNDQEFLRAIDGVIGGDDARAWRDRIVSGQWSSDGERVSKFGVGSVLALDDFISHRVVTESAVGDVRILAPNASGDRVLGSTELPALLESPRVTHINGIDKQVFQLIYNEAIVAGRGEEVARATLLDAVVASSAELARTVSFAPDGNDLKVATGTFLEGVAPTQTLAPDTSNIRNVGDVLSDEIRSTPLEESRWHRGALALGQASTIVRLGSNYLGVAGGAASVFGAYYKAHEIKLALERDDLDGAKVLLAEYAAKGAGSWAAGAAAASAAGTLLSPLLAGGPVGGVAYLLLTGSAAVVGGFWGGEAVDKIINALRGEDGGVGLIDGAVTLDKQNFLRITEFANGVRYVQPIDSYSEVIDGVTHVHAIANDTRLPSVSVPDGAGGYTTIEGTPTGSRVAQWAGRPGQSVLQREVVTTVGSAGSVEAKSYVNGQLVGTNVLHHTADGQVHEILTTYQPDGAVNSIEDKVTSASGDQLVRQYDGDGNQTSKVIVEYFHDENGVSRMETVTTAAGTVRNGYDTDGNLVSTHAVDTANLDLSRTAIIANDLINFSQTLASNAPAGYKLASGAVLLNKIINPGGQKYPNFGTAATVAQGALALYNLTQAFENGNDLSKASATLNTLNFANQALGSAGQALNASLDKALNGTGLVNGAPGVLPAIGLVTSIKAKDPIGIAQSAIALINPALLFNPGVGLTPLGWVLMAAQILRAILDDGPPDAWGTAKVTFGEGFNNLTNLVTTTGENFGPDRVRQQMQGTLSALEALAGQSNATRPADQQIGIIGMRMPVLNWRASEFADQGYAVADVDMTTGEQRYPDLRFDDEGRLFGIDPNSVTPELRRMLNVEGAPSSFTQLDAYMLWSAIQRGALAPMWEVRTAKMQQQAGDSNAGLTEEERAAKIGLAAPADAQYAAAHPNDPDADNKRQGHFMAVGLDLGGDGRIDARTIAQNQAAGTDVAFDWDGQGYKKRTGWIGSSDGFLMLDHNFNQSADGAKELFSNPLVADAGKGLRLLSAYDANADGKIDAGDPVYEQLKVWQDLNQDGDNTETMVLGGTAVLVQDETAGQKELRGLRELGITSIDYANGRYEMGAGNYRKIATQTLEAEEAGVRYTPVGAGIQVEFTDGAPQIVITQVLSEDAVLTSLGISASDEVIGVPGAELYEDGVPTSYDPATQGGAREIVIGVDLLLQNDTWAGGAGAAAGLAITGVRAGAHTSVSLRSDGNISLWLEPNYNGPAEFFYTVAAPGYNTVAPKEARVGLNITSVNDAPTVSNALAPDRGIYGYQALTVNYTTATGDGENREYAYHTASARGLPLYEPYTEHIAPQPIYGWGMFGTGENVEYREGIIGYTPEQYIPRTTVIATDKPNVGTVLASDPDGGSFRFELLSQPLYGSASVDAAGNWSYVGRRPNGFQAGDITGDGWEDYVNFGSTTTTLAMQGDIFSGTQERNIYSNDYGPDEPAPFLDYFTVRVYDNSDPTGRTFRDVEIAATHYGPPPVPEVTDSGGKKPIAIDLDGDGFHFTDVDDSNVFFDVNGDGWKRKISWPKPGDGLLAFDQDGNGKIENFDEISFVPHAPNAQTDLEALKEAFDTNANGVFDAGDEKWASFGVWHDVDQDGVTDAGEYVSLDAMGISSISLTSDGQFRVIDGQTVHGIGTANKTDGTTLAVADVTLTYSNETKIVSTLPDGTQTTTEVPLANVTAGEQFEGTAGPDLVFGTNGSDWFTMLDGDDVVVDDQGDDMVQAGSGADQIYTGVGNDIVDAGSGGDAVFAGAGNDLVFGDGAEEAFGGDDVLVLEDGNDIAFGGAGNDVIAGGTGNDALSGDAGNDQLLGEDGWDALFGQEGDDELWGMAGNDLLDGGEGNDLLSGGAGDDEMEGGQGDDTYEVDAVSDQVIEAAGGGTDTVNASITYTLSTHLENLTLLGTQGLVGTGNAADNVLVGNDGNNTLYGLGGDDALDGGLGADLLVGGAGNDVYHIDNAGDQVQEAAGGGTDTVRSRISTQLGSYVENLTLVGVNAINGKGNALDNVLVGNIAANVLDGGAGADVMRGGKGDDVYVVDHVSDSVVELAGEGVDSVLASVSYVLSGHVENLTLTGAAITASGNALDNVLTGNDQGNWLDGGLGADTMAGGTGDDQYVVDQAGDVVVEQADAGNDTVRSAIDYTLGANVENLTLTGAAVAATGNALGNILTGNASANLLDGAAGADAMHGGLGDDTYLVDHAGDAAIEQADAGTDTARASVSFALGAHVENLVLTGSADLAGSGNGQDNVIIGNAGNNQLDGGAGADALSGGGGDDSYVVDNIQDTVTEFAGQGHDKVFSSVSYSLSAHVEDLALTGTANLSATGNALANQLRGNAGHNLLDGGAGADHMAGGAGDDSYVVDDAADVVFERADEGKDTVYAGLSYSLAANVENLTLTGAGDTDGTGNALANVLLGNSGNNRLDGGAGADQMAGGAGDDAYFVDNVGDVVIEQADAGTDTVFSSVSHTLSSHVDHLILTGTADLDGTGNALGNTLVGNSGSNRLDGGLGADQLAGGAGDDHYVVDNIADTVHEEVGQGSDTIHASVTYTLSHEVEALVLTGSADIDGTGNALDNQLRGNAGRNVLDGASGADAMAGAAGDDTYVVDNAGDVIVEAAGEGADLVLATVSYGLAANVENLTLAGGADIDGTGNALVNRLVGNGGRNTLDGAAGADWMAGGTGDDTYVVDDAADQVVEQPGEGEDTVLAGMSYSLSANVENLTLTGSGNTSAIGNELANRLIGNAGANLLDGGAGADQMAGGAGDDSYIVDDAADAVVEQAGGGADTVFSSVDHTLADQVEHLSLTGTGDIDGTGNELDNQLTGNGGSNLLDGAAGADTMAGGAGDDTYVVDHAGDAVVEWFDHGTDTVLSGIDYVLPEHVERLRLTGTAVRGTGNVLDNELWGNDQDNLLDGAAGADAMAGAAGSDRYVVDNAADSITELAGEGDDTVESSVSYALSGHVENLTLTGDAVAGTGNELDNRLIGNAQANLLDGREGSDQMAGGSGDDTYIVDNESDTVAEHADQGHDTVVASASHTLSADVEDLRLVGSSHIDGTGNDLANLIAGNAGNNRLAGGAGDDTYEYALGGGLDTIADTSGVDMLRFGPGLTLENVALRIATVDGQKIAQIRVLDADGNEMPDQGVDYVMVIDAQNRLSSPIEAFVMDDGTSYVWSDLLIQSTSLAGTKDADLIIAGRNDDAIDGGNGDDAIYGGSGHDSLVGANGADILFGGGGKDSLYGGNDGDELYGEGGDDSLWGDNGNDVLIDLKGNNSFWGGNHSDIAQGGAGDDYVADTGNEGDLATGGAGSDSLSMGNGDDWVAGGTGNDLIDTGTGRNLVAFNRGDGADTLRSSGKDVLSLGAIRYADMALTKSGSDLVLNLGQGDSLTLKDWYSGNKNRTVEKLQVVTVGMDYDAASSDKTRNRQVEVFDFAKLAQKFDAARAANASSASGWAVMNSLLDAHLQGSDAAALGGDLSFQYATAGSLAGIGVAAAQASLAAGSADLQTLKPRSELEQGPVRLV